MVSIRIPFEVSRFLFISVRLAISRSDKRSQKSKNSRFLMGEKFPNLIFNFKLLINQLKINKQKKTKTCNNDSIGNSFKVSKELFQKAN